MTVGGFDTLYQSPFWCDADHFLKLELLGKKFKRIIRAHFYHFGSRATKCGNEGDMFRNTENKAAQTFHYKWGFIPDIVKNAMTKDNFQVTE